MTRDADRDTMGRVAHPIDDDDVAGLVRDVAAGWVMPPVRLDQPAWRDRIRSPRSRRADGIRGWFGHLGQAAAGAVVLTVAAAVLAVFVTMPFGKPGPTSTGPASTGTSPGPSGIVASPLPKLFVSGEAPSPGRVVVQTEAGSYAVADLASGTLGPAFTAPGPDSQVRRAPNGDLVCLCTTFDGLAFDQYTHATVVLERFDASYTVASRTTVLDVTGHPDPRDGLLPAEPNHVTVATTFSADGRYAYVGWSARAHPDWTSGVVVVDLGDGSVVQRLDLPAHSDGTGDSRFQVDAPRVVGQAGDRAVIDRHRWSWAPATAVEPSALFDTEVFIASTAGGHLGTPDLLEAASACGEDVNLAGPLPDGGFWLSCASYGGSALTTIRRVDAGGSKLGDTSIHASVVDGSTTAVSPDRATLYVWDPVGLTLHAIDLATGAERRAAAPAASATAGSALAAFGRWLAPATMAKTFLQPGLAVSPDGTRVYAVGIIGNPAAADFTGSAGVVVFDTPTMTAVGRWAPTADFVSIAVSADGAFVYAAGNAGFEADGSPAAVQASITVFDARDGSIRLIAGQLGSRMLTFANPVLQ